MVISDCDGRTWLVVASGPLSKSLCQTSKPTLICIIVVQWRRWLCRTCYVLTDFRVKWSSGVVMATERRGSVYEAFRGWRVWLMGARLIRGSAAVGSTSRRWSNLLLNGRERFDLHKPVLWCVQTKVGGAVNKVTEWGLELVWRLTCWSVG